MYDVKSPKAEEFISHQEILDTLAYAEENKENRELLDAIFSTRKSLPLSIGGSISVNSLEPEVPFAVFHLCNISFSFIFN